MYRQSEKKLVKWQYLLHMSSMVNFSPLTAEIYWRVWDTQQISTGSRLCFDPLKAEICWRVWGTLRIPANFSGFRVLASLLQRRRSPEANQTLHDVWPSPALVYCIRTLGSCCPLTELCRLQNSLCVQVLHTVRHSSSGRQPNFVAWY